MAINLYDYQKAAINKLKSGSILCGGVGSGKSRTAIAYYFFKECKFENNKMKTPKDLYIITTAKKRDSLEWEGECAAFVISTKREFSVSGVKVIVDSWNNISKYIKVENAFFIFDEQRIVGSGTWVKSFLKIAKKNNWILASATPGDTWTDYIPVFIGNGFYKNRTEFLGRHAVYSRFAKFPKIEKFVETKRLCKLRDDITVVMEYSKHTTSHDRIVLIPYNKELYKQVMVKRWNVFTNRPVKAAGELCYLLRKIVNSDPSRLEAVSNIIKKHPKVIIFYNFDYELAMLKELGLYLKIPVGEWNGHNHQPIPENDTWMYLVQYTAGAEGWNCIKTDVTIFFSQNYSYKTMVQAAGRIDRLNTPFMDLYYYHIRSNSPIDLAITQALKKKRNFNVRSFIDTKE